MILSKFEVSLKEKSNTTNLTDASVVKFYAGNVFLGEVNVDRSEKAVYTYLTPIGKFPLEGI